MKTVKFTVLAILLLVTFSGRIFSQEKGDIKKILTGIIELSKAKKYEEAAKYVAYCADEKKKEYKPLQPGDKTQLNQIIRILKRIGALAEVSSSFNIGDSAPMNIGGSSFQKVSVEFISGSQKIVSKFNFVALNGTLLLAEVE